ncbi:hypothetical protein [Pseudomonas sp. ES3]|uniref:hypothetical protein n=1 Tax=Pseudomonas sp. ES3 TaxID=3424776 RepID=UPI003D325C2B
MDYPKSVPNIGLVDGKFVDENPTTGQIGSLITSAWSVAITDEVLGVIRDAGLVPEESDNGQLKAAIRAISEQATYTREQIETMIASASSDIQKLKTMAVVGGYRRLSIVTTGLDGNISVTAEQVTVGGAEYVKTLNNIGFTINSLSVGANGLDSGAMAASTWYGVWVIWNSATAAIAGLLSLSGAAPLLPAGFTHKALVGWVFTDATANKFPLSQIKKDKRVVWKTAPGSNVATPRRMANGAAGNPSAGTWVPVSTTAYVSPTAISIKVELVNYTASAAGVAPNAGYGPVQEYLNPPPICSFFVGGSGGAPGKTTGDLLLESANIYWASVNENLFCLGYEDSV